MVLVGLLPTGLFRDLHAVMLVVIAAAIALPAVAAGGYLINDCLDVRRDRLHPRKRHRPIASGAIAPRTAIIAGAGNHSRRDCHRRSDNASSRHRLGQLLPTFR